MSGSSKAIFLSYASEDAEAAQRICDGLRSAGIEVWFDRSELRGGDAWDASIRKQVKECALLVPVISANTQARKEGYFRLEWKLAVDRSHLIADGEAFLLPVTIDNVKQSDAVVPDKFREVQWTRVPAGVVPEDFVERVRRLLAPGSELPQSATKVALTINSEAPQKSSRGMFIAIGAGIAAAAIALGFRYATREQGVTAAPPSAEIFPSLSPRNAVPERSIAVLPFADMSEKKDQEYFADGMAEEVLDLLAKIPGIRVIGRTSSFQFKGKSEDLRRIGTTLGCHYVVEGSVRKSADRIRVTAQLISVQDGSHLWSQKYDESTGDILQIQSKIAAELSRALQVTIGADDLLLTPPLRNVAAYDLYLRGRHSLDRFDRTGFEEATSQFQQALAIDPLLLRAIEWLAMNQANMAEWAYTSSSAGYEEARATAQRALKLDSRSTLGHVVLCIVYRSYEWNWARAMDECQLALAREPRNPIALKAASVVFATIGRWDDAVKLQREALAIDPLSADGWVGLSNLHLKLNRYQDAESESREALRISPTYAGAHMGIGESLLLQGRLEMALSEVQQESFDLFRLTGRALVFHAMGRHKESDVALAEMERRHANDDAYDIATIYSFRGEIQHALTWLDRAYQQKDPVLSSIKGDPLFRNLEGNPRFKKFLHKLNLPD